MHTIRVAVFTGRMSKSRAAMEAEARARGIDAQPRVTHLTTHVVVGDRPGNTKLDAAKKYGAEVISESQYRRAMAEGKVPGGTTQANVPAEPERDAPKEAKRARRRKAQAGWLKPLKAAGRGIGF